MVNKGQRRAHVRSTMQQYAPLHHPINYSLSTTPSAAVDIIHMLRKISRAAESLGIEQRGEEKKTKNNHGPVVLEPRCQSFCRKPWPAPRISGKSW